MEVGDLVWLDRRQFYEHDENVGIILEVLQTPDGKLLKVAWDNNEASWFHEDELEVISENR